MAEHLPDSVDDWPDDPPGVLGVTWDVDRKTLKQAYTRLIREYKPERFPEEFQRLRAAYEALLGHIQYRDITDAFDEDDSDWNVTTFPQDVDSSPVVVTRDHFQKALEGDPQAAYRSLENEPHGTDAALQLYWLLRLNTNLDDDREPIDWLCAHMTASRLSHDGLQLFREELEHDPELVARDGVFELLSSDADAWQIGEVADCLWRAACRTSRWALIRESLDRLRHTFFDEENLWLSGLVRLSEILAVHEGRPVDRLRAMIGREIDLMRHRETELIHEFDRLDEAYEIGRQCRGSSEMQHASRLAKFVVENWDRPDYELANEMRSYIAGWVENPREAGEELDDLEDAMPAAVVRLWQLVSSLEYFDEEFTAAEAAYLRGELMKALGKQARYLFQTELAFWEYLEIRRKLGRFCGTHLISFAALQHLIIDDASEFPGGYSLAEHMSEDRVGDCLVRAHLVYYE